MDPMEPMEPTGTTRRERSALVLAFVFLIVLAIIAGGCGQDSPLSPSLDAGGRAPESTYTRQSPPPFVRTSRTLGSVGPIGSLIQDVVDWVVVATTWVGADVDKVVTGSRYKLHFVPGSLETGAQVVIKEKTPDRLEFELGPHGIEFGEPVVLTIDFSGTNADTTSANYDGGGPPELYWYNPGTEVWERIPGKVEGTKYVAELQHFSLYGLARGKGGW